MDKELKQILHEMANQFSTLLLNSAIAPLNVPQELSKLIDSTARDIKKLKSSMFVKPTIEEVRDYCTQKKLEINPEVFWDHYQTNGWCVGKSKMKDWRSAARNWHRRSKPATLVGSVYREFKTEEDFKRFGL